MRLDADAGSRHNHIDSQQPSVGHDNDSSQSARAELGHCCIYRHVEPESMFLPASGHKGRFSINSHAKLGLLRPGSIIREIVDAKATVWDSHCSSFGRRHALLSQPSTVGTSQSAKLPES